jgi:phytoene desaturase
LKTAIIIGSGFAGLSAACHLAKAGADVTVLERHRQAGGRARSFSAEGFTWDMGPSWYWMPDVFERFFATFNKKPSDYYELVRLDPSYQVFWEAGAENIPASMPKLEALFERYEPGAGLRLRRFLKEAGSKYETAMRDLVYKPGLSLTEFIRPEVFRALFSMDLFKSVHNHARKFFSHPQLLQLVEFPILFLGALPRNTPALYTLMNYADMALGTWYPMGGMARIVEGMCQLATALGVRFRFDEVVQELTIANNRVSAVRTGRDCYIADTVIAACDYHHAESLLPAEFRNYPERYWERRDMAPSSLLYFVGVDRKLDTLQHHNLFFDAPFEAHAEALYTHPAWPEEPLMYVCVPSRTDASVAPEGSENLFILIPSAPGLEDRPELREKYFRIACERIQQRCGVDIRPHIRYQRSFAGSDFQSEYSAYKGNAYGLANTLRQTAILKPSLRNRKLRNLIYAGQLTVPGPGVPPALISGELAAAQALKSIQSTAKAPTL